MAWNERGNVCGAKTSSVKPPPLPVRKPPEPTKVTSVKPPTLPLRKPQQAPGVIFRSGASAYGGRYGS
jgi:hypothetical protein